MDLGSHTPRHGRHLLHLQRDGARCRLLLHRVASSRGLVAELVATTGTSPAPKRGNPEVGTRWGSFLGLKSWEIIEPKTFFGSYFMIVMGKMMKLTMGFSVVFPKTEANMTGSGVKVRQSKMGWHQLRCGVWPWRLLKYPRWTNWQWSVWKQSDDILMCCFQLNAENGLFLMVNDILMLLRPNGKFMLHSIIKKMLICNLPSGRQSSLTLKETPYLRNALVGSQKWKRSRTVVCGGFQVLQHL